MEKKSELSWTKKDFEKAGAEVPDNLLHDEVHSEGEMMSEEEVVEWLSDTIGVFSVIKQSDQSKFDDLYQKYLLDIEYLVKIDKISAEEAHELKKTERFEF